MVIKVTYKLPEKSAAQTFLIPWDSETMGPPDDKHDVVKRAVLWSLANDSAQMRLADDAGSPLVDPADTVELQWKSASVMLNTEIIPLAYVTAALAGAGPVDAAVGAGELFQNQDNGQNQDSGVV
jgi:hypothetical protein